MFYSILFFFVRVAGAKKYELPLLVGVFIVDAVQQNVQKSKKREVENGRERKMKSSRDAGKKVEEERERDREYEEKKERERENAK